MAWIVQISADARRGMRIDTHFESFKGSDQLASETSSSFMHRKKYTPEMISALPKTFRMLTERRTPLEHFVAGRFGWAVSITFKKILDRLEPENELENPRKNQFVPVTLLRRNGEPTGVPFYYWQCLTKLDAINIKKSDVVRRDVEIPGSESVTVLRFRKRLGANAVPPRVYLDKAKTTGRHVWWGNEHFSTNLFFSDQMKEAADAAGFKRFDYFHAIEI